MLNITKIKDMQIETTMRYLLTQVTMSIIKEIRNNKCWGGYGEKKTLMHGWWEYKLAYPL